MKMKRYLIICIIAALLFGCNCTENAGTTNIEMIEPYNNSTSNDAEIVIDSDEHSDIITQMYITDGRRYGCDFICWFDGFGFCYRVPREEKETYKILLSERVTIEETYSEEEIRRLEASPQDGESGYCVYLASNSTSYRIGFLRILEKPHIWGYGTLYEMITVGDPQAELLPVEPQYDYVWSNDAALFETVLEDGRVLMRLMQFEENDVGFGEIEDSIDESSLVEITDNTLVMICFFDSQRPDMLISNERMFQLVRDGYFMEYPCWVIVKDGKLLAAMQINSF